MRVRWIPLTRVGEEGYDFGRRMSATFLLRTVLTAGALLALGALAAPGVAVASELTATAAPHPHRHEFHHEIDQMEESWRNAMLKSDTAALDAMLADDYTGISSRGEIQTREQTLDALRAGTLRLSSLAITERKVRLYGATAVVTSVVDLTGTREASDLSGRYRYTHVYVRTPQGQWKIVSFEASRIQDGPERK